MADIVYISAARAPPSVDDPIQACPVDQCDITVVVKERGGKRRTIKDVTVKVDDHGETARTNDQGRARFIGVVPANANHAIEVTLQAATRRELVWVGQGGLLRKAVCDGIDTQTKMVAQQEDKLFIFWVMKRPTLTVEVNRYDEKQYSGAAHVRIATVPGGIAVYNADLPQGEHVLKFKPPYNDPPQLVNPIEPGQHTITVTKPQTKWGGGAVHAEERNWKLSANETGIVNLDLPPGAEKRVTFTLTPRTRVQFIAFNIKPGKDDRYCPTCGRQTRARETGSYGGRNVWRCDDCSNLIDENISYLGIENAEKDANKRCEILKKAISTAVSHALIDSNENILKLFMAPEFFFRGRDIGYPEDIISQIIPKMNKVTSKETYKDWLFVYGTAIGYLAHGKELETPREGGDPKKFHNLKIVNIETTTTFKVKRDSDKTPDICAYILDTAQAPYQWKIFQRKKRGVNAEGAIRSAQRLDNGNYRITLMAAPARNFKKGRVAFEQPQAAGERYLLKVLDTATDGIPLKTKITVTKERDATSVCARILTTDPVRWKVVQADKEIEISARERLDNGDYRLTLETDQPFVASPCYLIEPEAVEVFNIALVQKGGKDPHPQQTRLVRQGNLREVLIYKEYVSSIDYRGDFHSYNDFYDPDSHEIEFRGQQRTVLPTEGSGDTLGAVRNMPGQTPGQVSPEVAGPRKVSEINRTGLGGGSVFTVDGITFGLEVCLDHGQGKLQHYYSVAGASRGEPKVQIQLVPSAGMNITDASICCSHAGNLGLIFNVDGLRGESDAKEWNGNVTTDVDNVGVTPEVAMGKWSNVSEDKYFTEKGEIKVYPAKYIPDAETVP